MGRESIQQNSPDLFSTDAVRNVPSEPTKLGSVRIATAAKRHVLPENLDRAVKQLNDDELIQLIDVALKEAKQRGNRRYKKRLPHPKRYRSLVWPKRLLAESKSTLLK
jgi:hypothetical protein